jgi:hypothetical protein
MKINSITLYKKKKKLNLGSIIIEEKRAKNVVNKV